MSEALVVVETAGTDTTVPAASGARQFWRRLRAQRAALVAAAVVALLVLVALAAPLLTALEGQDPTTYHPALIDSARGGVPIGSFGGASADHWLGVEPQTGRDLFARLVYGARVSLGVSLAATLVQILVGVAMGVAAGLGNRWVDLVLSRITDLFLAIPLMVMALALLAVVPGDFPRPVLVALIIALVSGWSTMAKMVRAQTLALKNLDYVSASRLSGWSTWRTAVRELLPGLAAPVITYAALLVPSNISAEAALSFLGVGVKPPTPSWGQMLTSADVWYQAAPQYLLLPAIALFVTVFAMTVLGDGVRVALDPRAASRLRVGTGRKREARAGTATTSGTPGTPGTPGASATPETTAPPGTSATPGTASVSSVADSGPEKPEKPEKPNKEERP